MVLARGIAALTETGTRPHDIYPKNKKALFFSASGGGTRLTGSVSAAFRAGKGRSWAQARANASSAGHSMVTVKHVHHPGTAAHPYLLEGAQLAVSKAGLTDEVIVAWNKAG